VVTAVSSYAATALEDASSAKSAVSSGCLCGVDPFWRAPYRQEPLTVRGNRSTPVNLIVQHLTERGVMNAALLYEPPFTGYAPQGPKALFTSVQVDELFGLLEGITATALAA
jgi:type I site-specific restriction endonuclease